MYYVGGLELSQSHLEDHSMLGYLRPEMVTGLILVVVEGCRLVLVVPLTEGVGVYLTVVGPGILWVRSQYLVQQVHMDWQVA